MRALALIPLLIVAACGEAGTSRNEAAPKAAKASSIAAGQWELTAEVTGFEAADEGAPKINTPVGTRTTETVCVGAEARPPVELFSGPGYDCSYGEYYLRNGRANITLNCRREGTSGQIPVTVDGQIRDSEIELTRNVQTYFTTDGDVRIESRVTGRRSGDCAPEAAEAGAGNGSGGSGR